MKIAYIWWFCHKIKIFLRSSIGGAGADRSLVDSGSILHTLWVGLRTVVWNLLHCYDNKTPKCEWNQNILDGFFETILLPQNIWPIGTSKLIIRWILSRSIHNVTFTIIEKQLLYLITFLQHFIPFLNFLSKMKMFLYVPTMGGARGFVSWEVVLAEHNFSSDDRLLCLCCTILWVLIGVLEFLRWLVLWSRSLRRASLAWKQHWYVIGNTYFIKMSSNSIEFWWIQLNFCNYLDIQPILLPSSAPALFISHGYEFM